MRFDPLHAMDGEQTLQPQARTQVGLSNVIAIWPGSRRQAMASSPSLAPGQAGARLSHASPRVRAWQSTRTARLIFCGTWPVPGCGFATIRGACRIHQAGPTLQRDEAFCERIMVHLVPATKAGCRCAAALKLFAAPNAGLMPLC